MIKFAVLLVIFVTVFLSIPISYAADSSRTKSKTPNGNQITNQAFFSEVFGEVTNYSGELTDQGQFFKSPTLIDEPCTPTTTLDEQDLDYHFHTQKFEVSEDGTYSITNISNTFDTEDSVMFLYSPTFNPANPLQNLIAVNDDFDFDNNIYRSAITCQLSKNTVYVAVTSTYLHNDVGVFANSITGPGIVTLIPDSSPTPVPTPTPSAAPTVVFIPGDINRNHRVDIFDFNLLITDFGKTDATSLRSDVNHNNRVDIFDFNILITNFGQSN